MQDTKRIWVWVGVAVIIVCGVLAFIWKPSLQTPIGTTNTTTNPASTSTSVYAPQGQLTPQLSRAFLLDGISVISNSYSIGTASGTNKYVAVVNASTSMKVLYNSYEQYFLHNAWGITKLSSTATSSLVAAQNASSTVSVAIYPAGTGSGVIITYVTK